MRIQLLISASILFLLASLQSAFAHQSGLEHALSASWSHILAYPVHFLGLLIPIVLIISAAYVLFFKSTPKNVKVRSKKK